MRTEEAAQLIEIYSVIAKDFLDASGNSSFHQWAEQGVVEVIQECCNKDGEQQSCGCSGPCLHAKPVCKVGLQGTSCILKLGLSIMTGQSCVSGTRSLRRG